MNPTENAISAVTKILQFNGSQVNMDQILPMWFVVITIIISRSYNSTIFRFSWLPVTEDVDEAPFVYNSDPFIFKEPRSYIKNYQGLPRPYC